MEEDRSLRRHLSRRIFIYYYYLNVILIFIVLVKFMRFPAFCTRIPHMTASSSDFPIEFLLYMCACMCHFFSDEGNLRGCRNI